jgi:ABC-type uncharacterized transport system auxiliary subunit
VADRTPAIRRPGWPVVALLAFMLGACTVLPTNGPRPRVFELLPPPETALAASAATGELLRVDFVSSHSGYDTEAMIYRQADHQLSRFVTGRWVAPPAQMITEAVATELERGGRFRAVLTEPGPATPDYRLDMTVLRLEQDYRRSDNGIARLTVRVRLTDAATGELLTSAIIDQSAQASAPGPEGFAAAAGVATRRFLRELDTLIQRGLDSP